MVASRPGKFIIVEACPFLLDSETGLTRPESKWLMLIRGATGGTSIFPIEDGGSSFLSQKFVHPVMAILARLAPARMRRASRIGKIWTVEFDRVLGRLFSIWRRLGGAHHEQGEANYVQTLELYETTQNGRIEEEKAMKN